MDSISKIVDLASYAGKIMLGSGADILRVENTIEYIMRSYGIFDFEVYTLTNGIFLSACGQEATISSSPTGAVGGRKLRDYLRIHNVPLVSTNLGKVDAVNTLSRDIEAGKYTVDDAMQKLCEIDSMEKSHLLIRMAASGAAAGSLCYMFGGGLVDSLAAAVVGFLYFVAVVYLDESRLSRLLTNIICAGVMTVLAVACVMLGFGSIDRIIVGTIMPLIPGVAFVNSIRDLAASDYLSGMIRLMDALITAFGVAIGVGATLAFFRAMGVAV